MRRRRCAITVDLDAFGVLLRYWGHTSDRGDEDFFARAIPRLIEILAHHRIRATFFVVGEDAGRHPRQIAALAAAGHEIASHSHTHPHAFARLGDRELRDELERAEHAIAAATGARPQGFRAPGYDVSERVLTLLAERGYSYDSSVFPSSFVLAARLAQAIMPGSARRGALGRASFMLAPLRPYRPSATRLWRHDPRRPLVELPVATLPLLRLPFHFTSLLVLGHPYARWGLGRLGDGDICFVLHGIDVLARDRDQIDPRLSRHPGVSMPLARKLDLLSTTLAALASRYDLVTARELVLVP